MTFTENLEKAKSGDKRAYGMLCNLSANKLYGVASLVLDSKEDAESTVRKAFDDGLRGIERINDENHLCAWLSRELTKHMVARLKEYRSEERTVKSDGSPEKNIFCKLGDLDRLVCALSLAFGYNVKEITVITGLKEETVERKIKDSDKKLGKDKAVITAFFENIKAPESLITKEPRVHDLTVEIDRTDDDELIGEMERIAAAAQAEEESQKDNFDNPKVIRFQPAKFEEPSEKSDVAEKKEEPGESKPRIMITPKAPEKPVEPKSSDKPEQKEETAKEEKEEPVKAETPAPSPVENIVSEVKETAVKEPAPETKEPVQPSEIKEDKPEEKKPPVEMPKELDARTFINVITTEKIKGRDFLKFMGNTRISNDVYREIEQNPNLTKEKLIELLENSTLTSADYYKVLTAIKQRKDLLARKEQANVLFNIKDKQAEKVDNAPTDTRSFTAPIKEDVKKAFSEKKEAEAPEERKTFDFVKNAEPEIKPFMPMEDAEPEEEDELEIDDIPAPPTKEKVQREKYKGREFFLDDDVYYHGVNNGKIIFAAVCAVILIGVSFAIRYFNTGSAFPGGEKHPSIVVESFPEEYVSDDDIYKAISLTENVVTQRSSDYYKAGAEAYGEVLTKVFCETDDKIYIADGNEIIAYSLDAEKPSELYRFTVDEEREYLGFTVSDNALYMLYAEQYDYPIAYTVTSADEEGNPVTSQHDAVIMRDRVVVERHENGALANTYRQDGKYNNARVTDEAFYLATTLNTADSSIGGVYESFLPSYDADGQDKAYIDYNSIIVPEKIGYNGFTVIVAVSGNDARATAVLGGSQSFVEFGDETCRVIISDKNKTYEENFRFVGSNLTQDSETVYSGECFGAEFISDKGAITYDSAANAINVINSSGGSSFALAEGETLSGAAFEGNFAHITTKMSEGSMLYCVDLSEAPVSTEAKPGAVYSEKLKGYGENELIGLTVQADSEGNRTGLRLSVYGYENGLKEKRYVDITLDEQTDSQYLKYLYADAEESNLRIAEENGYIAVATVYFDGISEIERILCFKDDGTSLSETTDLLLFDIQSKYRFLTLRDNILYVITDSRIITIDSESGKAKGYFSFDEAESPAETPAETEETTIE